MTESKDDETGADLKAELLHALFVLRSLQAHKLGWMKPGFAGRGRRDAHRHMHPHRNHEEDLNMPSFALL